MKKLILSFFILSLVSSISIISAVTISNCIDITASGIYELDRDIPTTMATCFNITADNVILDFKGYKITGDRAGKGVYMSGSRQFNTIKNGVIKNFYYGIDMSGASNNRVINMTIFADDFVTQKYGIVLGGDNNIIENTRINSSYSDGIYVSSSTNNTVLNSILTNNQNGLFVSSSQKNILTNITSINNFGSGLKIQDSLNNKITNSNFSENNIWDVDIIVSNAENCNNQLDNIIVSRGILLGYYNDTISLHDQDFAELILCNADNSNLNDINVYGSDSKKNNGILVVQTDYSNFDNINSSNNYYGFKLSYSSSNIFTDNAANNNYGGFYLDGKNNNNQFLNNLIKNNSYWGFNIFFLGIENNNNNILINNTFSNNEEGIIALGKNNKFINNTIKNNKKRAIFCGCDTACPSSPRLENTEIIGNIIENNSNGIIVGINAVNNNITKNIIKDNSFSGLFIYNNSNNNLIADNLVDHSGYNNPNPNLKTGIYITTNYNNTLINNNLMNNIRGLSITNSFNNILENIYASNNLKDGIYLKDSSNSTFKNINSNNNGEDGIYVGDSSNNTFTNIDASNNLESGIHLDQHNNTILNNITTNNNGDNGIVAIVSATGPYSGGVNIQNAVANNNDYDGIYLKGWLKNEYIFVSDIIANNNGYGGINVYEFELVNFNNISVSNGGTQGGFGGFAFDGWLRDSTIKNVFVDNESIDGIFSWGGGLNVTFDNIIVTNTNPGPHAFGIELNYFDNSTFKNIISRNNSGYGFHLGHGDNNILTNVSVNYNEKGMELEDSDNNTIIDSNFCFNNLQDVNCSSIQKQFTDNTCMDGGETCGGICLPCPLFPGDRCFLIDNLNTCNDAFLQEENPNSCAWKCEDGNCPPNNIPNGLLTDGDCKACEDIANTCGGYNNNITCEADPCNKKKYDCNEVNCNKNLNYGCFWNYTDDSCGFKCSDCTYDIEIIQDCTMVDIEEAIINYVGAPALTCPFVKVKYACANPVLLGFFTWINFIAVIAILIVIYYLYNRKNKGVFLVKRCRQKTKQK